MAPGTVKVTPFQEDRNPDTGTVIYSVPLYIKYKWF